MPALLHTFLAPVQVDALCRSKPGVKVVGYYHANELLTDLDLKPMARRLADRIQQQQGQAVTLLVTLLLLPLRVWTRTNAAPESDIWSLAQVDNGKLGAFADNASQDILQVGLRTAHLCLPTCAGILLLWFLGD